MWANFKLKETVAYTLWQNLIIAALRSLLVTDWLFCLNILFAE